MIESHISNKVSIVTVTFNCVNTIIETLKSIIYQNYENKEIIIIDGQSTDGTVAAIMSYIDKIDVFISEHDKGIYDAMNKAIDKATGDWICFMNAGDSFTDVNILSQIFSLPVSNYGVIYGDTMIVGEDYSQVQKAYPLKFMSKCLPFCHQSSFVRMSLIKQYKFDINFKICADYNLFLKIWKINSQFLYVEIPISNYDQKGGGFSERNLNRFYYERFLVAYRNKFVACIMYLILRMKLYLNSFLFGS